MADEGVQARPLQGVTGLYGTAGGRELTGRDPSNWGGPVDKRHQIPGDSSGEPQYDDAQVYGTAVETGPEVRPVPLPGLISDRTPAVHHAPYPAGVTHDPTVAAEQMRVLHGLDTGGPGLLARTPVPMQGPVDGGRSDSPNVTGLASGVPAQLRSGPAARDTAQGNGAELGYGFAFGRLFRRIVRDGVPLDRTGAVPGERPFYGHHPVGVTTYDVDSEFGPVAGNTRVAMNLGPTPVGDPTPYEQPANPAMKPTADYGGEAGFSGGWTAG